MGNDNTEIMSNISTLPAPVVSLQAWAERRAAFNEFINKQLKAGTDYGKVPGTDKPTLLKPGAEKIMQLYGCAVTLDIAERSQNPDTGYLYIECVAKAVSIQTGMIVATGIGACSSYESKYRWRKEWWNLKGIPSASDGWEQTRNNKWCRRVENRDLIDQWNTVIKMAKKRALVDLALTISGASEKFTQDVEDFAEQEQAHEQPPTEAPKAAAQPPTPPAADPAQPAAENGNGHGKQSGRPYDADTLKSALVKKAGKYGDKQVSQGQRGLLVGQLAGMTGHDRGEAAVEQERHIFTDYVFGRKSSKDLSGAECQAVLDWIGADGDMAKREFAAVVAAAQRDAGQQAFELPVDEPAGA